MAELQILVSAMLHPRRDCLRPCRSRSGWCQGNGRKAFRLVPSFPSGAMWCPTTPSEPCTGPRSPCSSAVPPPLPPMSPWLPRCSHMNSRLMTLRRMSPCATWGSGWFGGAVEAKECENSYRILVGSCGTQPDSNWDLLSNAHSREECLADPKLPRRWCTRPGKLISV